MSEAGKSVMIDKEEEGAVFPGAVVEGNQRKTTSLPLSYSKGSDLRTTTRDKRPAKHHAFKRENTDRPEERSSLKGRPSWYSTLKRIFHGRRIQMDED